MTAMRRKATQSMDDLHRRKALSATRPVPPKARIVPHLLPRPKELGRLGPITSTRMTGRRQGWLAAGSRCWDAVPCSKRRLTLPKHHSSTLVAMVLIGGPLGIS